MDEAIFLVKAIRGAGPVGDRHHHMCSLSTMVFSVMLVTLYSIFTSITITSMRHGGELTNSTSFLILDVSQKSDMCKKCMCYSSVGPKLLQIFICSLYSQSLTPRVHKSRVFLYKCHSLISDDNIYHYLIHLSLIYNQMSV